MTGVPDRGRSPRHALECELSSSVPGARVHAEMTAFYRRDEPYAAQQATHGVEYFRRLLAVMEDVLVGSPLRILEIGSGTARALRTFAATRPETRVVAVELSGASLRAMRDANGAALHAVGGDALALPLRDGSVDAVVAFEVVEHLPDVRQALHELVRVLRPSGHVIIGLPNHASLWTPLTDLCFRRTRAAFGVQGGRGAWRWWRRNAALACRKRLLRRDDFLYRAPVLGGSRGGDADAVYYAAPLDLIHFFRSRGWPLVATSARLRFGWLGRWWPVELQGSTVLAWRKPESIS